MMMKLEHPCIPHIIDLIENENYLLIIREYVEGRTLDSIVGENGPMPVETAINIAKKICGTLHYLHTYNPPFRERHRRDYETCGLSHVFRICYNIHGEFGILQNPWR